MPMSHAVLCQCVFNVFSMCVFNVCAMPMSHTIIGMSHACLHRFSLVPTLYCPACIVCPALPIPSSCLACLGLHRVSCIVLSCLYRISFLLVSASTGCPALPCLYKVSVLLVSAPHRVSCIALPSQSSCLACLGPPQGVFSSRLEKYLVEMYLKEKALFWGAAAAEQLVAQQSAAKNVGNTGQCSA